MRENSLCPKVDGERNQSSPPLAGLQILIVDDDEDSRFYISTVLEGDGDIFGNIIEDSRSLLGDWIPLSTSPVMLNYAISERNMPLPTYRESVISSSTTVATCL